MAKSVSLTDEELARIEEEVQKAPRPLRSDLRRLAIMLAKEEKAKAGRAALAQGEGEKG